MKTYIQRNQRRKGETEVMFYNCRLCPAPLMTPEERSNGICEACANQPAPFKVPEKKPISLGRRPHPTTRMRDKALQDRIDAVVKKARLEAAP